jgi:hypothetical protein
MLQTYGNSDSRAIYAGNYIQESFARDLRELNGEELRPLFLVARKQRFEAQLCRHDHLCPLFDI